MHNEDTPRSQRFAKLLDYKGAQVLVALQRDESEVLAVVVSLWSDAADMQVRALVQLESDDRASVAFDTLDQSNIAAFIEMTPLGAVVAGE